MDIISMILSVFTHLWNFLSNTPMPLFSNISILQFALLVTVLYWVIDFIVGLVSTGNDTSKGGVKGD